MKITEMRNQNNDPAWVEIGLKGFERRRRRRSQRGDKYLVLARLVTGVCTDSDSDLEYLSDGPYTPAHLLPEAWRETQKYGWVVFHKRKIDWDAKKWAPHLPKSGGGPGERSAKHIEKLEKKVTLYSSGSGRHINVYLVIVFPQSLEGMAKTWFEGLPRRKFMTWEQMRDCFLEEFGN